MPVTESNLDLVNSAGASTSEGFVPLPEEGRAPGPAFGSLRPYDFSTTVIDALLGRPAFMPGEETTAVRALENALSEEMADQSRPQSYVDIRAMASAIREANRLEQDRARLLSDAFATEAVAAVLAQRPDMVRQVEGLIAAERLDRAKLERLLAKAGLSFTFISSKALARARLQYDALTAMIDRAYKKARDAEAHAWRREEQRIKLRLMRKRAQDLNALDTFD